MQKQRIQSLIIEPSMLCTLVSSLQHKVVCTHSKSVKSLANCYYDPLVLGCCDLLYSICAEWFGRSWTWDDFCLFSGPQNEVDVLLPRANGTRRHFQNYTRARWRHGDRNPAKILWHSSGRLVHVCSQDGLSFCRLWIRKPVSGLYFFRFCVNLGWDTTTAKIFGYHIFSI